MTRLEVLEQLKNSTGYVTVDGQAYRETEATARERLELKLEKNNELQEILIQMQLEKEGIL